MVPLQIPQQAQTVSFSLVLVFLRSLVLESLQKSFYHGSLRVWSRNTALRLHFEASERAAVQHRQLASDFGVVQWSLATSTAPPTARLARQLLEAAVSKQDHDPPLCLPWLSLSVYVPKRQGCLINSQHGAWLHDTGDFLRMSFQLALSRNASLQHSPADRRYYDRC